MDPERAMGTITFKEANRRYRRVFFPVMAFYVVFCFAGPMLLDAVESPPVWARALVAVVTSLPIAGVFWLMARHLRETDEYTRKIQVDALLAGGGVTLSAAVIWGFLELFDVVPQPEAFPAMMMVGPTFFAAFGLAHAWQAFRRR
jgi:hypothetical protein